MRTKGVRMSCTVCPRHCPVDRQQTAGFCSCTDVARVARIGLHHDEEPAISGTNGSGTVFFTGCNLKCIFCQNHRINDGALGRAYTASELADAMLKLQSDGAHNINLVTPTPHRDTILSAIRHARQRGLNLPIVYNTNAYETVETIRMFEGLADIYLPDFKYADDRLAMAFSTAKDYCRVALDAITEMVRQVGFLKTDDNGIAVRGVHIRHLVLPNCVADTRSVLDLLLEAFGKDCPISIMAQYTPIPQCKKPPLHRRLTQREYDHAVEYALSLGFTNLTIQEASSVGAQYTPDFEV